jgi:hypothetical protein
MRGWKGPQNGYCAGCPSCEYTRWVPFHPEWKCSDGGEMDAWTTATEQCPHEQGQGTEGAGEGGE